MVIIEITYQIVYFFVWIYKHLAVDNLNLFLQFKNKIEQHDKCSCN